MINLVDTLLRLPLEQHKIIASAIEEADIARQMGNKKWRNVFLKYKKNASGRMKKIFAAMYHLESREALDVYWRELCRDSQ